VTQTGTTQAMSEKIILELAENADSAAILQLLAESGLPTDGVVEYLSGFVVARDKTAQVVGVAGIEYHGKIGLLRSVAVAPDWQKSKIGWQIVSTVLQKAQVKGIEEIVLLTTTARDYFARCFKFSETERRHYDEILHKSAEWNLPRCTSAIVMRLDLSAKNFGKQ